MSQVRGDRWVVVAIVPLLTVAVAVAEPTEDALRATCRITRGQVSGTAFFVAVDAAGGGKTVLVTAAHVLSNFKGPDCTLVLRAADREGNIVRREVVVPLQDGNKPLWVRHPELDVAALPVKLPDGVDVQPFAYRQIADGKATAERRVRVGQEVYIPCFPAQLEANPAGWPILRRGSIATHPLTPPTVAKSILVDYSHFGGDSGSPVVACDGKEPVVLAVVYAMQRQTLRTTSPYEERVTHVPLGLAVAVQAPFVRETIERLLKK